MKAAAVVKDQFTLGTAPRKAQKKGYGSTGPKVFRAFPPSSELVSQPAEWDLSPFQLLQPKHQPVTGETPPTGLLPSPLPNSLEEARPEASPWFTSRSKLSATWLDVLVDPRSGKDTLPSPEQPTPSSDPMILNALFGQIRQAEEEEEALPFPQRERGSEGEIAERTISLSLQQVQEGGELKEKMEVGEPPNAENVEQENTQGSQKVLLAHSYSEAQPAFRSPSLSPAEAEGEVFHLSVLEQVSQHLERLVHLRDQDGLRLYLQPPELGALDILVQVQGTEVQAQVATEQEWTRRMLERSIEQLRALLAERGLQLNGFQVSLGSFSQTDRFGGQNSFSSGPLDPPWRRIEPLSGDRRSLSTSFLTEVNPLGRWSIWV